MVVIVKCSIGFIKRMIAMGVRLLELYILSVWIMFFRLLAVGRIENNYVCYRYNLYYSQAEQNLGHD